jgi:hypothetical protein
MRIQLYLALRIVVIPAALAALALLAARFAGAHRKPGTRIVAIGAGAGALAALIGLAGLPPFPPVDSIGWIHITTALALVALPFLDRGPSDLGIFAVVAAVAAFLVGRPVW